MIPLALSHLFVHFLKLRQSLFVCPELTKESRLSNLQGPLVCAPEVQGLQRQALDAMADFFMWALRIKLGSLKSRAESFFQLCPVFNIGNLKKDLVKKLTKTTN